MGKIKQGILGGFNGTTGSVVGASWKGIAYMRGKAQSIKNPRTALQQENRTTFGLVSELISKALAVVNIGFRMYAVKQSAYNAAVRENMLIQANNQEEFDFSRVAFSKGSYANILSGTVTFESNTLTCTGILAEALPENGTVKLVVIVMAEELTSPLILSADASMNAGLTGFTGAIVVPSGLTKLSCTVQAFAYDTETFEASATANIGEYIAQ